MHSFARLSAFVLRVVPFAAIANDDGRGNYGRHRAAKTHSLDFFDYAHDVIASHDLWRMLLSCNARLLRSEELGHDCN